MIGLAVTTVMFVTTWLMTMVIVVVWKQRVLLALAFLVFFGSIDLLYISASLIKVTEGGWIPLVLSLFFMAIMYTWNYGTLKKHEFDVENRVSMKRLLASGPSLGMVRVPGIGLLYNNLVTGIPAVFGHFVTNLPAFHQVLVFVCVKSVQVPHVHEEERFLIGRIGPKGYKLFRCIVRYGYKDLQQENYDFENKLVHKIVDFIELEEEDHSHEYSISDGEALDAQTLQQLNRSPENYVVKEESVEVLKAKESGVAYVLGHSYAQAKKSSSLAKKFAINIFYTFLTKNCRGTDVVFNIPHTSLLEVGMIYYV